MPSIRQTLQSSFESSGIISLRSMKQDLLRIRALDAELRPQALVRLTRLQDLRKTHAKRSILTCLHDPTPAQCVQNVGTHAYIEARHAFVPELLLINIPNYSACCGCKIDTLSALPSALYPHERVAQGLRYPFRDRTSAPGCTPLRSPHAYAPPRRIPAYTRTPFDPV